MELERTNKYLKIDLRWDLKHGLLIKHFQRKRSDHQGAKKKVRRCANADAKLQKSVMN